jgi:hypothetical protein
MDRMDDKLDALWTEYRDACPDPEPGASFMPGMWQRIEARRNANVSIFRHFAQWCVTATIALTLLIAAVLIPKFQSNPVYSASYVDVLSAEHSTDYVDLLAGGVK